MRITYHLLVWYFLTLLTWCAISFLFQNSQFWYFIMFGVFNCIIFSIYRPTKHLGGILHWMIYFCLHEEYEEEEE